MLEIAQKLDSKDISADRTIHKGHNDFINFKNKYLKQTIIN